MSKRDKKSGGKAQPEKLISLTTAAINLATAILLLIEKLSE